MSPGEEETVSQDPRDRYTPSLPVGTVLQGRFEIVRFLGRGGMGEVYEANDPEIGRIALKTIRPDIAQNRNMRRRFTHEVQLALKVSGPNVCRIHYLFIGDDAGSIPFLTMEFLDGETLAERIRRGPLSIEEAKSIAKQFCAGLRAIHDAGLIHRDFKSGNVMLAKRHGAVQAVVTDFGLAREQAASAAAAGSNVSVVGARVGTLPYMALEQIEGRPVSAATDIFALGVVLYEMVTGTRPFPSETYEQAAEERVQPYAAASSLRAGLPREWDRVIGHCLEADPTKRYGSADEVADALLNRPSRLHKLRRGIARMTGNRYAQLAAAICVVLILLGAGGLYWSRQHVHRPPPEAVHWYEEGTAALRAGTYLKATGQLGRAVALDSKFVLAHARLADAWNELDFTAKAKDEMLQASSLELGGRLAENEKDYVEAVRDTIVRDFPAAVERYNSILRKLPKNMKAYGEVDLGRAYEKAGNIDNAVKAYSEAARLDPEYPASFVRLGILESRRKHNAAAETAFAHAEALYEASSDLEGIAEIDYQRGYAANTQGQLAQARTFLEKSLAAARLIPSVQLEVRALGRLSTTEYLGGNTQKSAELANQAIELARKNGIEYWAIDGQIRLGSAYLMAGDYGKADSYLQEALRLAQESQRPRLEALAQMTLASVRDQEGRTDEIIPLAEPALHFFRSNGFINESADSLALITRAQVDRGEFKKALASALELSEFAKKSNNPPAVLRAEETLGSVLLKLERYPEALNHFQAALSISRRLGQEIDYYSLECADVLWRLGSYADAEGKLASLSAADPELGSEQEEVLAEIRLSQKRYGETVKLARHALASSAFRTSTATVRLLTLSGLAHSAMGSTREAEALCRSALAEAKKQGDGESIARASLALASVYEAERSPEQAESLATAAYDFFARSGQKESELQSLICLSQIEKSSGDAASAGKFASQAMNIFSDLERDWSAPVYQAYLRRPDVQRERQELAQMKRG